MSSTSNGIDCKLTKRTRFVTGDGNFNIIISIIVSHNSKFHSKLKF